MKNPLLQFSPPLTLAIVFLIILEMLPSCLCDRHADCSAEFICGNTRARFPFWGHGRPRGCGVPELELRCANGITSIRFNNINYRVLQLNQAARILNIAREDFMNGPCQPNFVNTTLDPGLFEYLPGYTNLTFVYGCLTSTPSFIPSSSLFNCNADGLPNGLVLPGATGPGLCNSSVYVPVSASWAEFLGISVLENDLKKGFEVRWKINNTECDNCINSKGACGYDLIWNQPTCYCRGQSSGSTACSSSSESPDTKPGSKSKGVSVGVGAGVAGAVLVGILLGGWCLVIMRRRRSKAPQMEIKDMPEPSPSSKDSPTTTTNFSQSTSSYPSSKSDIEKGSSYFGVQVFSYNELRKATDNFDSSKELGDGGFGTVYLGKLTDGRVVAVKRLYEGNMKRAEQFINEVQILANLRHKNLVTLYGCTPRRSQELLLVYEYIPNGTVADHLHGRRADSRLLTWPLRLNIAIETADALAYLHASDVIHRDIKTNNILLDNKFSVKVADFGLSRLFPNDVSHVSTAPQGTPGYVDPEYYQCYQLTNKSDVYSFGVVLIELISSSEAVDTKRTREDINLANMAINRIQNHAVNELVDPCLGFEKDFAIKRTVTAVAELAFLCLQQERLMRPTMEEVLRALKRIEKEYLGSGKAKVVDFRKDDVGLLNHVPIPHSPDSVVQHKWVSSSTTSDSF